MRILTASDFQTTPWKNGGGITHEIARRPAADDATTHRIDASWRWRLSIAEVATDGPFSRFDGYSRILTVIAGDGVDLYGPTGALEARLGQPVHFPGDMPITSQLVGGPIRDLNVIYNPDSIAASVTLIAGPTELSLGMHEIDCQYGCLALAGEVRIDGVLLSVDDFALGPSGRVAVEAGASALLVELQELGNTVSQPRPLLT